jgi:hypothetical protein
MPVEIRELVIRATTEERKDANDSDLRASRPEEDSAESREALIQECVRQVLRILRKEKER